MAGVRGTGSQLIAAGRERCIAILIDVERYPEWYDTLDAVTVSRRDELGRPEAVTVVADAGPLGLLTVDLRFAYELPGAIVARQTGGDGRIVGLRSRWVLEEVDAETTRASYSLEASAGDRRTAAAMRVAGGLVRRGLVDEFPRALRRVAS